MLITDLRSKLDATFSHFKSELAKIRTGQASTSVVEDLEVAAYSGVDTLTLKELASLSAPAPDLILAEPWDESVIPAIEKSLRQASFNPVVASNLIRIPIPALSEERRQELVKTVHTKAEESKISMRNTRRDAMKAIDKLKESKEISEDEFFRKRQEVEEEVTKSHKAIDELVQSKEQTLTL